MPAVARLTFVSTLLRRLEACFDAYAMAGPGSVAGALAVRSAKRRAAAQALVACRREYTHLAAENAAATPEERAAVEAALAALAADWAALNAERSALADQLDHYLAAATQPTSGQADNVTLLPAKRG
ncbi:MAG: hypothetical protein EA356_11725 [Geminicoccaceae bacterium]|nr:MAG: hypothetical protein EA356_11725 [Geminicoccaceae bacterium]